MRKCATKRQPSLAHPVTLTMPQTLDARKAKLARWPTVHRSAFSRQKQSRTFVQLIPQKIQLGKGFSRRPSALWTVNSFSIQAFLYWG